MIMRTLIAILLLLPLQAFCQGLPGESGTSFGQANSPEFLPVDEAYQIEVEVLDAGHVRVYWQIAADYYLYQHSFRFTLEDSGKPVPVEPAFPPALTHTDDYFGEVSVYYTDADIVLAAAHPFGADARLTVTYQGCADAGLCYPPQSRAFILDPVALTAGPADCTRGGRMAGNVGAVGRAG